MHSYRSRNQDEMQEVEIEEKDFAEDALICDQITRDLVSSSKGCSRAEKSTLALAPSEKGIPKLEVQNLAKSKKTKALNLRSPESRND